MKLKLFTWNVLSSSFYGSKFYPTYDPNFFDLERKNKQILKVITDMICENHLIVLYEVCDHLRSDLIKLALDIEYVVRDAYYSSEKSGNMGIVMMWPKEYRLMEYEQVKIGQHIHDETPINKTWIQWCSEWLWNIKTPLEDAKSKHNVMILATLTYKGLDKFTLAAYHMPCAFYSPKVMEYHLKTVWKFCEKMEKNIILCMDMNTTPKESLYDYLPSKGMISANTFKGDEPEYTIKVQTERMNKIFKETIDYVWVTKSLIGDVESVLPETTDLLPNDNFPSDHYWMKFVLTF